MFSRSERFVEKINPTPGPGYYDVKYADDDPYKRFGFLAKTKRFNAADNPDNNPNCPYSRMSLSVSLPSLGLTTDNSSNNSNGGDIGSGSFYGVPNTPDSLVSRDSPTTGGTTTPESGGSGGGPGTSPNSRSFGSGGLTDRRLSTTSSTISAPLTPRASKSTESLGATLRAEERLKKELTEMAERLEKARTAHQKELDALLEKQKKTEALYQKTLKEKTTLQTQLVSKDSEIADLDTKHSNLKSRLDKAEKTASAVTDKANKTTFLQKRTDELEKSNARLKQALQEQQQQSEKLSQQVEAERRRWNETSQQHATQVAQLENKVRQSCLSETELGQMVREMQEALAANRESMAILEKQLVDNEAEARTQRDQLVKEHQAYCDRLEQGHKASLEALAQGHKDSLETIERDHSATLATLAADVEQQRRTNNRLQQELSDADRREDELHAAHEKTLQELDGVRQSLNQQIEQANSERQQYMKDRHDFESSSGKLMNELAQSRDELVKVQGERSSLERQLEQRDDRIQGLEANVAALQVREKDLLSTVEIEQQRYASLVDEFEAFKQEAEAYKKAAEANKKAAEIQAQELECLRMSHADLERLHEREQEERVQQEAEWKTKLEQAQDEVKTTRASLDAARDEVDSLQTHLAGQSTEYMALKGAIQEIHRVAMMTEEVDINREWKDQVVEITNILLQHQTDRRHFEQTLLEIQAKHEVLTSTYHQLQQVLEAKQELLESTQKDHEEQRKRHSIFGHEYAALLKKMELLEEEIRRLRGQVDFLEAENIGKAAIVKALQDEYDYQEKIIRDLSQADDASGDISRLEEELRILTNHTREMDEWVKTVKEDAEKYREAYLTADIAREQTLLDMGRLHDQIGELENSKQLLEMQLQSEVSLLLRKHQLSTEEMVKLAKASNEANQQNNLKAKIKQVAQLKDENVELKKKQISLANHRDSLRLKCLRLERELETYKDAADGTPPATLAKMVKKRQQRLEEHHQMMQRPQERQSRCASPTPSVVSSLNIPSTCQLQFQRRPRSLSNSTTRSWSSERRARSDSVSSVPAAAAAAVPSLPPPPPSGQPITSTAPATAPLVATISTTATTTATSTTTTTTTASLSPKLVRASSPAPAFNKTRSPSKDSRRPASSSPAAAPPAPASSCSKASLPTTIAGPPKAMVRSRAARAYLTGGK